MNWKNLGISLVTGLAFAFVMYILYESPDAFALGMLLSYMNYKITSLKEEVLGMSPSESAEKKKK